MQEATIASGSEVQEPDATLNSGRKQVWIAWIPLVVLPPACMLLRSVSSPWVLMWLLAGAIFIGCKWQTWWCARAGGFHSVSRSVAYLFLWPGMDASAFLTGTRPPKPAWTAWCWALLKTCGGIALLWLVARRVPAELPLLRGWFGLLGLVFLLHFGSFDLIALGWQSLGVRAEPIMQSPATSCSLGEFWGRRWNLGFRQLSHELVFRPLYLRIGLPAATLLVFFVSGLIHELVISVPARGGYGLPTAYFVLQGLGMIFERSRAGRFLGLARGVRGWAFTTVITAGPVYFLFHPPFVFRVILPFMKAIHAL